MQLTISFNLVSNYQRAQPRCEQTANTFASFRYLLANNLFTTCAIGRHGSCCSPCRSISLILLPLSRK